MALLEVSNVSIEFGGIQALSDVSFCADEGEILSIIGPNGAGKTTLLNCISGAYVPTGSIRMKGLEMVHLKAHSRPRLGISRTFQNIALFPGESVIENVLIGSDYGFKYGLLRTCLYWTRYGCSALEREARKAALESLEILGLKEYAEVPAGDLPYGSQKRVELARAMVAKPTLLLLDEPTAGITGEEKYALIKHINMLNKQEKISIVMIEHDIRIVMDISDKIVVLDFGKKIAEGKPAEILQNQLVKRAYLGEEDI